MKPVKKKRPQISAKASASGKRWSPIEWGCVGIDTSTYAISASVIVKTKDGKIRAGSHGIRWTKETEFFKRMAIASRSADFMQDLFATVKIMPELNEIYIGMEEPAAISHVSKGQSQYVMQQMLMGGAILGGILKWGWTQTWLIPAKSWQAHIAPDLGITTHHTKWNPTKKEGKFRAKEWVQQFHPKWDGSWPDIIPHSTKGQIPRPEGSKARGTQSDDRYETLAMADYMRAELKSGNLG